MAGCNQSAQESDKDQVLQADPGVSNQDKRAVIGEGHQLAGAELQPFLKRLGYVIPVNYGSYYLTSEVPTCSSAPNKMGTPATYPCQNTKDAALFPRRAANATTTTADLGLMVYMYRLNVAKNFDLNSIWVYEGTITLYAFRVDINSWWYWNLTPGRWSFPVNATNLSQIQIFGLNKNGTYTVDDIQLNGRP